MAQSAIQSLSVGALTSLVTTITWLLLREYHINNNVRIALLLLVLMSICGFSFSSYAVMYFLIEVAAFLLCSSLALTLLIADTTNKSQEGRLSLVAIIITLELFFHIFLIAATPGYIIPFLRHPIAIVVLIILFIWQIVGVLLLSTKLWLSNRVQTSLSVVVFLIFFACPIIVTPMIGPVAVTIVHGY